MGILACSGSGQWERALTLCAHSMARGLDLVMHNHSILRMECEQHGLLETEFAVLFRLDKVCSDHAHGEEHLKAATRSCPLATRVTVKPELAQGEDSRAVLSTRSVRGRLRTSCQGAQTPCISMPLMEQMA